MTTQTETLASGPGWRVSNVVCSAGPHDRPFEEQHASVCIAIVMRGSFQYRTTQGAATLVPGAILLGNHQSCFECGHEHAVGDRCLSFMFAPDYFASIISSIGGVRAKSFAVASLPPLRSLTRIVADAELASSAHDKAWFEQLALGLAGSAAALVADSVRRDPAPGPRDEHRIAVALQRIELNPSAVLSVAELAEGSAMSPYHFLRVFRRVVGMTPHQFILHRRLRTAAVRLRQSSEPILDIALDAGFGDLSTFNRRFRTIIGVTPSAYRRGLY